MNRFERVLLTLASTLLAIVAALLLTLLGALVLHVVRLL